MKGKTFIKTGALQAVPCPQADPFDLWAAVFASQI